MKNLLDLQNEEAKKEKKDTPKLSDWNIDPIEGETYAPKTIQRANKEENNLV